MDEMKNKMGTMPVPKLLITMALPMMISMLIQALYNIVDSMFVARISEDALTAVSLAFPVQQLLISVAVGTGIGVNACLSRALGERKQDKVDMLANHAVVLVIITTLVSAVLGLLLSRPFMKMQTGNAEIVEMGTSYLTIISTVSIGLYGAVVGERLLQGVGLSFETMLSQGAGAITNIILDPIFIFTFDMGISGAAIATVIGQMTALLIVIIMNKKKNHFIHINLKGFRFDSKCVKMIYTIAIPSSLMMALSGVMTCLMNMILITFSTTATAIMGVYLKLQSFFMMPLFGTTNALLPIVSYNLGAEKKDRMYQAIHLAMVIATVFMTLGMIVFWVFPEQLLSLFNASADMLLMGKPAMRSISLNFIFAGIAICCSNVFQATGKPKYSLIVSLIRQIIILIPAAYLLSLTGNVRNVWIAFPIAEALGFVLSIIMYKRCMGKIQFHES